MDIHTQQLRHFMELAKCLNFTKAAMNLYIAQPALSQQIADLEKQLGVTLFERTSRSVTLTPAGEILKEHCPQILSNISSVHQQLLSAQAGLCGNLKIAYLCSFQTVLPDLVQQYQEMYPDVAIDFSFGTPKELLTAVRNQDADVVFTILDQDLMDELHAFKHRIMWKEGLDLVLRKDHPFVTSGGTDYSLLRNDTFTLLNDENTPGYQRLVQKVCNETGIPMNKVTTCPTGWPIFIQVDSGMCVSILASGLADLACSKHADLVSISITQDCMYHCAVWNPSSKNAALPLFLDVLESTLDSAAN